MRGWIYGAMCAGLLAGTAHGAPVDQSEARQFLYPVRGVDLLIVRDSALDAGQLAIVGEILKQVSAQGQANYYGAIAVSPSFFEMMAGDPAGAASSGLLQVSEKFHSGAAAEAFAMSACDAARTSGQKPCVIAAKVAPEGWTARPLQMSVAATEAFVKYRKGAGPKAMAISPATTAFAAARGTAAGITALTACNAGATPAGFADCEIVIED